MAGRVLSFAITTGSVVLETVTSLFHVIFVPWRSSYEPIKSFLNVENDLKDVQTSSWRDRKLAELTFVGITVSLVEPLFPAVKNCRRGLRLTRSLLHSQCALITGAVVQAVTWPQAQTPSKLPLGLWYSSLVLSLVAICLATQQSVALNRTSSYRDCTSRIRSLLGQKLLSEDSDRSETWVPRMLQLYVWQTPIMLLNFGILAFVIGLGIMVFENINRTDNSGNASTGVDGKVCC